jgi:hypothetical protein
MEKLVAKHRMLWALEQAEIIGTTCRNLDKPEAAARLFEWCAKQKDPELAAGIIELRVKHRQVGANVDTILQAAKESYKVVSEQQGEFSFGEPVKPRKATKKPVRGKKTPSRQRVAERSAPSK